MPEATQLRDGAFFFFAGKMSSLEEVVTYRHKRDGRMLLLKGEVNLFNKDANVHEWHVAPTVIPIKANTRYVITAHSDEVLTSCVHVLEEGEDFPPVYDKGVI